ncbi:hypothetical protein N8E89_19590 (plasmid) [Phyllobacterium sp. A18/5-2]|uniref:hypothetical protein n=1 Tax=Phyllobacterium sp. A18/5-2 TaxID=2978392 RepID=UPI0021C7431D|nr:hypothetical protein [Phyllobacterium sp. A18/5-2]UXN66802.1 hypothetical protein N8E89_19590 [Phyllobacterium sp. A18/5-2]
MVDFDTAGGDVIRFGNYVSNGAGFEDFDSFIAASQDTAAGVYVSFAGDTNGILIEDISFADLSADDLVFI